LKKITSIFAERLLREKGIIEFLKAAKVKKLKYPDTKFIVPGNLGPNPSSIIRHIDKYV